jgi:GGDEF domain-containing protein
MHLKIEDYEVIGQKYGRTIARQMSDAAEPALNKVLGEADVLAKLDLGEFIVMLPGKTQGEASVLLKKMRNATSHCVMPMVDRPLDLKFCHGIAELKAEETAQELLARARHAAIPPAIIRRPPEVQAIS